MVRYYDIWKHKLIPLQRHAKDKDLRGLHGGREALEQETWFPLETSLSFILAAAEPLDSWIRIQNIVFGIHAHRRCVGTRKTKRLGSHSLFHWLHKRYAMKPVARSCTLGTGNV